MQWCNVVVRLELSEKLSIATIETEVSPCVSVNSLSQSCSLTGLSTVYMSTKSVLDQIFMMPDIILQTNGLLWTGLEATLTGHHSAITSLKISTEYSVIVSADCTGHCIIWDLNKYVTLVNVLVLILFWLNVFRNEALIL